MRIITINLPHRYLDAIACLIDLGYYPSRSEAIRIALREFLGSEIEMFSKLEKGYFEKIKRAQLKSMIEL